MAINIINQNHEHPSASAAYSVKAGSGPGVVVPIFIPSTQEAEEGRHDQLGPHREFWASQDYIVKPCLKQNRRTTNKQKSVGAGPYCLRTAPESLYDINASR